MLGKALNREQTAEKFADFYEKNQKLVTDITSKILKIKNQRYLLIYEQVLLKTAVEPQATEIWAILLI